MTRQQRRNERARELGYRNYYDQRIQEGLQRGYSRDIARGHPKQSEIGAYEQRKLKDVQKTPGAEQFEMRDEILERFEISDAEGFANLMVEFGMTKHNAYTLFYGYELAVAA